jgi:hypothetical protein
VTLPEKVDLLVSELVGSIASEEGMYTSIRDAHLRHLKRPEEPLSYIPVRCQTVVAPASAAREIELEALPQPPTSILCLAHEHVPR